MFWSELILAHLPQKPNLLEEEKHLTAVYLTGYHHWETCMRNIYVGDKRLLQDPRSLEGPSSLFKKIGVTFYEGYEAYRFLLEVILGLHSELLGENEVFHQFRQSFSQINPPHTISTNNNTPSTEKQTVSLTKDKIQPSMLLKNYIHKLCMDLTFDSRIIRTTYMQALGEISYGGVTHHILRKEKKSKHIILMGTGQLAQALLPWLIHESYSVTVVGRSQKSLVHLHDKLKQDKQTKQIQHDKKKIDEISKSYPTPYQAVSYKNGLFQFATYDTLQINEQYTYTLLIACPINLVEIESHISNFNFIDLILDFRHDFINEQLILRKSKPHAYYNLKDITSFIEQSQNRRSQILKNISPELDTLVSKRRHICRQGGSGWNEGSIFYSF